MNDGSLSRTMTEAIRRLVRLKHLDYRQVDAGHLEVRSGERKAVVTLTTGAWENESATGKGIFSLGRHLMLDEQVVLEQWTKAAGGGR